MNRVTGALGGNISVNLVVCMGKLLLPLAAQPWYPGGTWCLCSLHPQTWGREERLPSVLF